MHQQRLKRRRTRKRVDIEQQKDWVARAYNDADGFGMVELDLRDNVRATRRRITVAAHQLGLVIRWREPELVYRLIFRVIDPSSVTKRTRKQKS